MEDLVLVDILNAFNLSETKALSKQNYKKPAAATQVLESQLLADRAQMLISKMTAETGQDRLP